MDQNFCIEKLRFYITKHHNYSFMNNRIMKELQGVGCSRDVKLFEGSDSNVKALQTTGPLKSHALSVLRKWIISMILKDKVVPDPKISDYWVSFYQEGDHTVPHHHLPTLYAFNYFIKTPKGSSPLIFSTSNTIIEPEEGKLLIFPSNLIHHVPPNNCNERIVFSGNIIDNTTINPEDWMRGITKFQ